MTEQTRLLAEQAALTARIRAHLPHVDDDRVRAALAAVVDRVTAADGFGDLAPGRPGEWFEPESQALEVDVLRAIDSIWPPHHVHVHADTEPHTRIEITRRPTRPTGGVCPLHRPTTHRDGKPPWCDLCGLDAAENTPTGPDPAAHLWQPGALVVSVAADHRPGAIGRLRNTPGPHDEAIVAWDTDGTVGNYPRQALRVIHDRQRLTVGAHVVDIGNDHRPYRRTGLVIDITTDRATVQWPDDTRTDHPLRHPDRGIIRVHP